MSAPPEQSAPTEPASEAAGLLGRLTDVVWWGGFLLFGLVAAAAVVGLVVLLSDTLGSGIDRNGLLWMAVASAVVVAGCSALAGVVVLARRGHDAVALGIGLGTIVATRAIAIVTIPTPLTTDWADYHNRATILASGGPWESARPPGWPFVLSLLYRVGGPEPVLGEAFALLCAVGVGVLIYLLARRSFGDVAAAAGLFLWAISPGPAAFSAVLASEHLYTLLFVAALALGVLALERGWTTFIGVGVLLGISQYVRPVSLVALPAFMVFPFLAGLAPRRAALAALGTLLAFALVIGPGVAWQYERYGRLTLSMSNFDGWNLLIGLNVEHGGVYNRDDLALVDAAPETVEFRDRSYRLAFERLRQNPAGVLVLAAPKFVTMWGDSTYGPTWALKPDSPTHPRAAAALTVLSQVAYTIVALLAAGFLWTRRHLRPRDPLILISMLTLGAVALSAVFLEVQPRYHAAFEPILCLLAGAAAARMADLGWRRSRARDAPDAPEPSAGAIPQGSDPTLTAAG